MKIISTYGTFDEAVDNSNAAVQKIARALRKLIVELHPDVVEVPWPKQGIIGYGVGPKKMSEHYCYIGTYSDYVNLGFFHGAGLPDPQGVLEGTGKNLRHIKVRDPSEVDRPAVRQMIQRSLAERQKALGSNG